MPRSSSNSPEQIGGQGLQGGGHDWGWTDMHLDTAQAQRINSRIPIYTYVYLAEY